jgi:hypothetical protein
MAPILVDDVLDVIFQNCTPNSVAVISQTSSRTYILAIPCLLRNVRLLQAPQAHRFLQFILHGSQSRLFPHGIARYVVDLSLGREVFQTLDAISRGHAIMEGQPDYPCSQLAPALTAAIHGMTNLQSFEIQSNTEGAMKHSPDLAQALLKLPVLRTLSLTDVWAEASNALATAVAAIQGGKLSHISTLKLIVNAPLNHPQATSPGFHRFISHLSPHLVNLDIENIDLSGILADTASPPAVFAMILRLRISQGLVSLEELSCAFPNVTHLELGSYQARPFQRSHRLSLTLFPHLVALEASCQHIETILKSPLPSGQQREMRLLDFTSVDESRSTDIATLLSGVRSERSQKSFFRPGNI